MSQIYGRLARIYARSDKTSQPIDSLAVRAKESPAKKGGLPEPVGELRQRNFFAPVKELFFAGGGGAGRSLPAAMNEAVRFGLNPANIKEITATSVGVILALALTLEIPVEKLHELLDKMPTDQFQDWSLESIKNFLIGNQWGFCAGRAMPNYFRKLIQETTKLNDPTFLELYNAGYKKELRIITGNVSDCTIDISSYKETPDRKVADMAGVACGIPIVFPVTWIVNKQGKLEAHTDGGIIKNYPWRIGSSPNTKLEEQLGFMFVNESAAEAINSSEKGRPIDSIWKYLSNILTMLVFQDPLNLSESVKKRTVAIKVKRSPLRFDATEPEQEILDYEGKTGVQRLVADNLQHEKEKTEEGIKENRGEKSQSPTYLPGFNKCKIPQASEVDATLSWVHRRCTL